MKQHRLALPVLSLVFAFLSMAPPASARPRRPWEDAEVVGRADAIVVASVKEGSIAFLPGTDRIPRAHLLTLVITEVIKGTVDNKEVQIILHSGLTPVVGGVYERDGMGLYFGKNDANYPKDIIEIFDTASGAYALRAGDLRKDALWFLRGPAGIRDGGRPGDDHIGVRDPEDVRPLTLKAHFLLYLSDDPEKGILAEQTTDPRVARANQRFLIHCEIQRILKVADPAERAQKLIPYFFLRCHYSLKGEARDALKGCGALVGPMLLAYFDNSPYTNARGEIIEMWVAVKYTDCVPILINILTRLDRFWAAQKLEGNWWERWNSESNRKRRTQYDEVRHAVWGLSELGDPRAKDALEMTKRRWESISFLNKDIVEMCESALKKMSEKR